MSLSVDGVWKVGVWATTVWADGVWREGDPPPDPDPVDTSTPSGGFYGDFHVFFGKPRKKLDERIEEIEDEAKKIANDVDREIAKILRVQEAKDAERADLARLQALADRYAAPGVEVPRPVLASVMKAHEERSRNALEQMRREIERMMDEEEQAVIALLLLED